MRRIHSSLQFISDINMTNLVDVTLVLLIIFMIAAPLVQQGVDVQLPKAPAKSLPGKKEYLTLSMTKDKKIFINQTEVERTLLKEKLIQIYRQRADKELFFKADKDLTYGFVMQVVADIKAAGIEKLGMVTAPPEEK